MGGHIGTFSAASFYAFARLCFASYFLIHPLTALMGLLFWLTKKGLLFVFKRLCPWCTFTNTEETVENTINDDISLDVLPDVAEDPNENGAAELTDELADNQNQSIEVEGEIEGSDASDSPEVAHDSDLDEIRSTGLLENSENEEESSLPLHDDNNENPDLCHHLGEDEDGLANGGQTEEATEIDQVEIEEDYTDDFIAEDDDEEELNETLRERVPESFEIESETVEEDPKNAEMDQIKLGNRLTPVDIETSESFPAGFEGLGNSATRGRDPSENIEIGVSSPEGLCLQQNSLRYFQEIIFLFKI
jgi:hypothetical protein